MIMILHIVKMREWQAALEKGVYHPASLDTEGFIHCSTPEQLLEPANERFRGQQGLALLGIDPEKVVAPIIYEDSYASGQAFPHIYGPLNIEAVRVVIPFSPQEDGRFLLPTELKGESSSSG
jgi:uncharacterized protein (DUF952 family)